MKLIVVFLLLFTGINAQINPAKTESFGKGAVVMYAGSAGISRHFDLSKLQSQNKPFINSPSLVLGADICFNSKASNAYLGIGPFLSTNMAATGSLKNRSYNYGWSDVLLAVRGTHHCTLFVTEKLDVCTGFILGTRVKHFSYDLNNESKASGNYNFAPAFGISVTLKYYVQPNVGFYIDSGVGYGIDKVNVGLCYRFKTKSNI